MVKPLKQALIAHGQQVYLTNKLEATRKNPLSNVWASWREMARLLGQASRRNQTGGGHAATPPTVAVVRASSCSRPPILTTRIVARDVAGPLPQLRLVGYAPAVAGRFHVERIRRSLEIGHFSGLESQRDSVPKPRVGPRISAHGFRRWGVVGSGWAFPRALPSAGFGGALHRTVHGPNACPNFGKCRYP